jgi:hypothetical protein
MKEAQIELEHFIKNNREETLISIFGSQAIGTFEVSAIECSDAHNDPTGSYFREDLNPGQVVLTGWMKEFFDKEKLKEAL